MVSLQDIRVRTADIVVPVYNEEQALEEFHQHLVSALEGLPCAATIYYVDDGSTDGTGAALSRIAQGDRRVVAVRLSRNFGHQAALTAGLDLTTGDCVVTLDGDGEHPPELIPQMISLYQTGYEVVLTQRVDETGTSGLKRLTSAAFYSLLNRIGDTKVVPGSADYRLLSRKVVDALKGMPEYHRFLRGMIAWMGYRTVIVPYTPARRLGGRTKYSAAKMAKLAMDATFSFSLVPLQIGISLGLCFLLMAGLEAAYVLSLWLGGQQSTLEPGWSSLMFVVLAVGGFSMIIMGFVGMYVGYIFQEVKRRPPYLVASVQRGSPDSPSSIE